MKTSFRLQLWAISLCFSLPLVAAAQTIQITGTIIDSVTSQPVPNAVITLKEAPSITTLTDAVGAFVLSGVPSYARPINLRTTMGISDATTVGIFNARGEQIYRAKDESPNAAGQLQGTKAISAGLYFAQTQSGWGTRLGTIPGIRTQGQKQGFSAAAGLSRSTAAYSITISKSNFASKEITVASGTAQAGTIRLRAVQPTLPLPPMKRISLNVPAYASGTYSIWNGPSLANDTSVYNGWSSTSVPTWIAYDLSSVPVAQRQKTLLVWYDPSIGGYPGGGTSGLPADYSIEINTAPGGGSAAPTTGWVTVASITGNVINSRHHEINMNGANWIRMNISGSPDNHVHFDLDVYSVPEGVTDSWLFLGDSITSMALARPWCTLQTHVYDGSNKLAYPPQVNGAVGGTSSWQGLQIIDSMMMSTPARFIALAYGTNDHAFDGASTLFSRMDTICMKIIAAGRIPVVPILPWPNATSQTEALQKDSMLREIWKKYPTQVFKGPDLYTLFKNRGDLIPTGDVHPNSAGMEVLRQAWATEMLKIYQ